MAHTTNSLPPPVAPGTVLVASCQMSSELGAIDKNCATATQLCKQAAADGAKFIVLPETCLTGYLSEDFRTNWHIKTEGDTKQQRPNTFPHGKDPAPFAQPCPGPLTEHFSALAKELGCYITVPFLEVAQKKREEVNKTNDVDDDDAATSSTLSSSSCVAYYNTVCLATPEGTIAARHRKITPWPVPEKSWATAGSEEEFCVVDTPYGRVAMAICFEIHNILRVCEPHKIWCLLYPIAWVGEPCEWFRRDLPQRLRDVSCPHYILGCNWSVEKQENANKKWPGAGWSTHWGPRGELLASTADDVGSTIIYSSLFTASHPRFVAKQQQRLDLRKYAEWTKDQQPTPFPWK